MANLAARMLEVAGFGAVGRIMRIPSFRIYIIGHVPNVVGVWVVRIAIGWLTWQLTESGLWLGAVAAADAMPVLLLGPIGGVLADRFDRRRISIAAQVVLTAISVVLTALTAAGAMGIVLLFSRSAEHTSELQSLMRTSYDVFCLKKK